MPKESAKKSESVQRLEDDVRAIRSAPSAIRPLSANRMQQAEFTRTVYRAITPLEDEVEQIMSPKYWASLQHQLKPLDRIEVMPDDRRFHMELLVMSVQLNHVTVVQLSFVELPTVALGEEVPSQYKIAYAGPYEKFRVLDSDRVLISQLETADMAKRWLHDHLKAQTL